MPPDDHRLRRVPGKARGKATSPLNRRLDQRVALGTQRWCTAGCAVRKMTTHSDAEWYCIICTHKCKSSVPSQAGSARTATEFSAQTRPEDNLHPNESRRSILKTLLTTTTTSTKQGFQF